MRLAEFAGVEGVHPRAAALRFARVPIGVEGAEVGAGGAVLDFVEGYLRVPGFRRAVQGRIECLAGGEMDGFLLGNGDAEDFCGDAEHAFHDAVDGEVGAEVFVVDVVVFLAAALGPVGDFPWFEGLGGGVGFGGLVFGKLLGVGEESFADLGVDAFNEGECGFAVARHAALEGEVGEVFVAEDFGFFLAEFEDFPDEVGVVVGSFRADGGRCLPDGLAEFLIVSVLHDGKHGGRVEGEAPCGCFDAFCGGVGGGGGFRGIGEAGEFRLIGDDDFPCVGGIEDVLRIFFGDLGKLGVDGGDPGLFGVGQGGSGFDEIGDGFLDVALLDFC